MFKPATNKVLAEIFIQKGFFTNESAQQYLTEAQDIKESLDSYLIRNEILTDRAIVAALAEHFQLSIVDLKSQTIEATVIEKVPVKIATYYEFMPVEISDGEMTIAVSSPLDTRTQDELRVHLGFEPKIVLALKHDIQESLKKYYGLGSDTIDRILTRQPEKRRRAEGSAGAGVEDIETKSEDPSVTKLVNQIIFEAYKKRATDIHIEPYRSKIRLRYRIDGVLVDANLPTEAKHFILPIISRIKIMSNLSITEKRLPQDGSTVVRTKEQDLDLRISTIPTPRGESMVIRILPTKTMLFSLEKLGFNQHNAKKFRNLVEKPHGIIFVTGPTGSGKTTTLYACLNEINLPQRKIITIEDPVEYEMEGITQIQVNSKFELDFARGLRSILRHDPDILMVGEVRDLETAEIAIRTALTGHLVFSTLHTNDAASGVTRLIDMGVEPYLVASSVEAFVAQRLVRVICSRCKEEDFNTQKDIKEEIKRSLKLSSLDAVKIYRGRGCDHCNHTGFYGRSAIYEIMEFTESLRQAILEKPRAEYIKQIAVGDGMVTLRQDGWKAVLEGITSPLEVINVTVKEKFEVFDEAIAKAKEAMSVSSVATVSPLSDEVFKDILVRKKDQKSRTYIRVAAEAPICYMHVEKDAQNPAQATPLGPMHATMTKDISAAGLSFVGKEFIPPGTWLSLNIDLDEGKRTINSLAKICRIEEGDAPGTYQLAVQYVEISPADRDKLDHFVKDRMNASLATSQ